MRSPKMNQKKGFFKGASIGTQTEENREEKTDIEDRLIQAKTEAELSEWHLKSEIEMLKSQLETQVSENEKLR